MRNPKMIFMGKTIVITGASAGIGQELALVLARQGANLVLAARNQAALAAVIEQIEQERRHLAQVQNAQAIAVPTDITQTQECQYLIDQAIQTFGQIDILINNAGLSMVTYFDEIKDLSLDVQVFPDKLGWLRFCPSNSKNLNIEFKGKILPWLKLIVPSMVDRMAARAARTIQAKS
jgi:NAD(P)-dependent dehydrogenase (short-subunit alcohol dehydrogenase family)